MDPSGPKLSFSLSKVGGSGSNKSSTSTTPISQIRNNGFSLSVSKASSGEPSTKATTRNTSRPSLPFGDDSDEEKGLTIPSNEPATSSTKTTRKKVDASNKSFIAASSATSLSRQARKLQEEALKIDQSVFEYDELWDGMQSAREAAKEAKAEEAAERKPKYIESFLQSAATRRMDRLRAEDKMLQHERDKEGDEFADKDKFVTSGYKKQMEEVRAAEEEEKKKEHRDQASKTGPGMTTFYRNMLDADEERHRAAMDAASASASKQSKGPSLAIRPPPSKTNKPLSTVSYDETEAESDPFLRQQAVAAQKAREAALESAAHAQGPVVEILPANSSRGDDAAESRPIDNKLEVNDDGVIVDHRVLLKAGLNITKKPALSLSSHGGREKQDAAGEGRYQSRAVGESASYAARIARERDRLAQQLREEKDREVKEAREREREEEEKAMLRKMGGNTREEGEAKRKAAKERFEERKKRKMEEEIAAKGQSTSG